MACVYLFEGNWSTFLEMLSFDDKSLVERLRINFLRVQVVKNLQTVKLPWYTDWKWQAWLCQEASIYKHLKTSPINTFYAVCFIEDKNEVETFIDSQCPANK